MNRSLRVSYPQTHREVEEHSKKEKKETEDEVLVIVLVNQMCLMLFTQAVTHNVADWAESIYSTQSGCTAWGLV